LEPKSEKAALPLVSSRSSRGLRLCGIGVMIAFVVAIVVGLSELMRHADVPRLIQQYGVWFYFFTFVWTFVEGETFVLVAGFAAAQGLLSAPLLLLAAWLGSFSGDQCYFWIGRTYGLRLLSHRPRWRAQVDSALGWIKRYDKWFILSFRFIYGVRNFSSFALGISGIAWQRFLLLNFLAAFLWAVAFVGGGYFCGRALERMLGEIAEQFSMLALAAFLAAVAAAAIVHKLRRRRRAAEAATPSS
jgi:membrane protein DedA with SNARE-associated domain